MDVGEARSRVVEGEEEGSPDSCRPINMTGCNTIWTRAIYGAFPMG